MKKYTSPYIEISDTSDVITTSADITTEGIDFPWSSGGSKAASVDSSSATFFEL